VAGLGQFFNSLGLQVSQPQASIFKVLRRLDRAGEGNAGRENKQCLRFLPGDLTVTKPVSSLSSWPHKPLRSIDAAFSGSLSPHCPTRRLDDKANGRHILMKLLQKFLVTPLRRDPLGSWIRRDGSGRFFTFSDTPARPLKVI